MRRKGSVAGRAGGEREREGGPMVMQDRVRAKAVRALRFRRARAAAVRRRIGRLRQPVVSTRRINQPRHPTASTNGVNQRRQPAGAGSADARSFVRLRRGIFLRIAVGVRIDDRTVIADRRAGRDARRLHTIQAHDVQHRLAARE